MKIEEIGVASRLRMRGLKNIGLIEISEEPGTGDSFLVISKGIRQKWYRKWLKINLPEKMWRVKCSRDEVCEVVNRFLAGEDLA